MKKTYTVNPAKCKGCLSCSGVCPVKALRVEQGVRRFRIDETLCIGCGICYQICAYEAIIPTEAAATAE